MTYPIHDAAQALLDAEDEMHQLEQELEECDDKEYDFDSRQAALDRAIAGRHAYTDARRALRDALAARAQPTTDDVLWEGETVHKPTQPGYPDEPISQLPFGVWFDAPPETHVQVVRSQLMPCPSGCGCVTAEDPDRNDCACDGPCCMAEQWPIPVRRVVRATDQPSEDRRGRLVEISEDKGATWRYLPDHAHWKLFAADPGLPVGQTYEAPNGDLYRWRWADQPTEVAGDGQP